MTSAAQPECRFFISSRRHPSQVLIRDVPEGLISGEKNSIAAFLRMNPIKRDLFWWFVFRAKDRFH